METPKGFTGEPVTRGQVPYGMLIGPVAGGRMRAFLPVPVTHTGSPTKERNASQAGIHSAKRLHSDTGHFDLEQMQPPDEPCIA